MKQNLIIILTLFVCSQGFTNELNTIVKANIIKGESLVTVDIAPSEIEELFIEELSKQKIKISGTEVIGNIYVDIFVFQFPVDYPTIAVTVRTKEGLHFFDKEKIKLFGNRKKANLKIAKILAKRLPTRIHLANQYLINFEDILSKRTSINLIHNASNSVAQSYRKKYSHNLDWNENQPIPFFIEEFDQYLNFCLNYQGIRKKIKRQGDIVLNLSIDPKGITKIERIDAPFKLEEKEKLRLEQAISALPLWLNQEELTDIELTISLK